MLQVRAEDVDVFLKGGGALDINSVRKKPKVGLTNISSCGLLYALVHCSVTIACIDCLNWSYAWPELVASARPAQLQSF